MSTSLNRRFLNLRLLAPATRDTFVVGQATRTFWKIAAATNPFPTPPRPKDSIEIRQYDGLMNELRKGFPQKTWNRFFTYEGAKADPPTQRELKRFQRQLLGQARRLLYKRYMHAIRKLPHLPGIRHGFTTQEIAEIKAQMEKLRKERDPRTGKLNGKMGAAEKLAKSYDVTSRHIRRLIQK